MTSPQNRVALVTGAARGIGAGIAAKLAANGHPVVLADVIDEVEATAAALRAEGHDARAIRLDVADEQAVAALPIALGATVRLSDEVNVGAPFRSGTVVGYGTVTPEHFPVPADLPAYPVVLVSGPDSVAAWSLDRLDSAR